MIRLFEHTSPAVCLESHYDNVSGEYVLTLRTSSEGETTERFRHLDAFEARLAALERRLGRVGLGCARRPAAGRTDDWRLA